VRIAIMRNRLLFLIGFGGLACFAASAQQAKPDGQSATTRTLKIKLSYTGSGPVDEKHKILVFLFDTPDFVKGDAMPLGASQQAAAKTTTVTFTDLTVSPVYAAAVYDPTGGYDGQSGPPPSGSSLGMYAKTPGTPEPIKIDPGKAAEIDLSFDDTVKMP
jgi:hypothetical protein